jgi:hypothetical protein
VKELGEKKFLSFLLLHKDCSAHKVLSSLERERVECVYIKGVILMKAYGVIEFSSGAHARDNFVLSPMYLHLKIPFPRLFYAHRKRYFSRAAFFQPRCAQETHKGVCDELGKCESDFMTRPLSYNALSRRKETPFFLEAKLFANRSCRKKLRWLKFACIKRVIFI